jgi:hemoglobin-like flavoprotein
VNLDQITLVKESFRLASPRIDEVAQRFYADLFARHPELRSMFATDLTAQRAKLVDELVAIVDALDHLGELVGRTSELGVRHAAYGVAPEHYEFVGESLRRALGAVLGDRYDADVDTAWRLAYNLVAETMVLGAGSGARPGQARLGGRVTG